MVLFFDITPEKARERGGYGEERYEKEEMQLRVRNFFHRIGKEMDDGTQSASSTRWVSIDAGRGREEVEHDVWGLVEPLVTHGVNGPVGKLWTSAP